MFFSSSHNLHIHEGFVRISYLWSLQQCSGFQICSEKTYLHFNLMGWCDPVIPGGSKAIDSQRQAQRIEAKQQNKAKHSMEFVTTCFWESAAFARMARDRAVRTE